MWSQTSQGTCIESRRQQLCESFYIWVLELNLWLLSLVAGIFNLWVILQIPEVNPSWEHNVFPFICMLMFICVCAFVCTHMCRPEVSVSCFSWWLNTFCFHTGSFSKSGAHRFQLVWLPYKPWGNWSIRHLIQDAGFPWKRMIKVSFIWKGMAFPGIHIE